MRKLSAILLLFPVAVLFVGAVRLGSICMTRPATQYAKMDSSCAADGCGACHKANDQPKEKKSCCLECPICALVTFSPEFRLEVVRTEKTTEYAVMPDNPLSDYFHQHWKPPSPSFLS